MLGEWLAAVFCSTYGYHTLLSIQTGALHPHLNCGEVRDVFVPLPSLEEQKNVVSYISDRLTSLDSLVKEAEAGIALLKERRAALISAAVTGKIDVRETASAEEVAA